MNPPSEAESLFTPRNFAAFLLVSLIWGGTWLVIRDQIASVPASRDLVGIGGRSGHWKTQERVSYRGAPVNRFGPTRTRSPVCAALPGHHVP